jgi:hypothetical protein
MNSQPINNATPEKTTPLLLSKDNEPPVMPRRTATVLKPIEFKTPEKTTPLTRPRDQTPPPAPRRSLGF